MARKLGETASVVSDILKNIEAGNIDVGLGSGINETVPATAEPSIAEIQAKQEATIDYTKEAANEARKIRKAAREASAKAQAKEIEEAKIGNTLLDPGIYDSFSPDIQVNAPQQKADGLTSENLARSTVIDSTGKPDPNTARSASRIDMSKLDESMIMNMPFIKPTTDVVPTILFLKPKDPMIRFHWVNFKNWEGGNYQRFRAYGFENASPADVDQEATPVTDNCIEGTEIKWYDVILMKINVITLMSLYKRNIVASLNMVGRFHEKARSAAQKQFDMDINAGLVDKGPNKGMSLRTALRNMKLAGHNVEFYIPGLEDVAELNSDFLHDEAS